MPLAESQMLSKKQKGDQTISKTVGDHSGDKALSPQRHDRQCDPYEQNRHQSDPALVEMSLPEDEHLQSSIRPQAFLPFRRQIGRTISRPALALDAFCATRFLAHTRSPGLEPSIPQTEHRRSEDRSAIRQS